MKIKTSLTLFTMLFSGLAVASNSEHNDIGGFKIAVIKNAVGSTEIVSGDYQSAISKISIANRDSSPFEAATGMCVANLKLRKFELATQACNQAVSFIESTSASTYSPYIKAITYSNRGIVRFLNNDEYGAFDDFTSAILLSNNNVISHNLSHFKQASISVKKADSYAKVFN